MIDSKPIKKNVSNKELLIHVSKQDMLLATLHLTHFLQRLEYKIDVVCQLC